MLPETQRLRRNESQIYQPIYLSESLDRVLIVGAESESLLVRIYGLVPKLQANIRSPLARKALPPLFLQSNALLGILDRAVVLLVGAIRRGAVAQQNMVSARYAHASNE